MPTAAGRPDPAGGDSRPVSGGARLDQKLGEVGSEVWTELLLRQRHWKYKTFCVEYDTVANALDPGLTGTWPSRASPWGLTKVWIEDPTTSTSSWSSSLAITRCAEARDYCRRQVIHTRPMTGCLRRLLRRVDR